MLDIAINAYIALFCAIFLFVSFTVYSLLGKRVKKLKVDTHLGDYEVGAGSDSDDSPDRNYSHTSSYIRQRPSHHTYSTNIYAGSRQVPNKNARTANVSGHGAYSPINEHGKRFDINTPIHGIEMSPNTQRRPSYRDDLPQQLHSYQQQSPSYQYTQQNYQQTQYQQQQQQYPQLDDSQSDVSTPPYNQERHRDIIAQGNALNNGISTAISSQRGQTRQNCKSTIVENLQVTPSTGLKGSTPLINVRLLVPTDASTSISNSNTDSCTLPPSTTYTTLPHDTPVTNIIDACSSGKLNQDQQHHDNSSLNIIDMADVKLETMVGGGGFGQVWRGSWRGTPVAVKILSPIIQTDRDSTSDKMLQSFRDECLILARARHPNICLFMGASFDPPQRAIITEFVARGSLWDALRCDSKELFPDYNCVQALGQMFWPNWAVKRVLEGTCMGLLYLHKHTPPIIHRDLKSANLLLSEAFQVKICDFGLARLRNLTQAMTANVGTPQWMAPEVISGGAYCESADIYSVGLVAWELCTGQCPFDGMNSSQIVAAVILRGERPPLPANMTNEQATLLQRCWAKESDRRLTAEQVLAALPCCFPTPS